MTLPLKATVKVEESFENVCVRFWHLCVKAFGSHIEATSHWEANLGIIDSF